MFAVKPSNSGSTTGSGRKVGRIAPSTRSREWPGDRERVERRIGGGQHFKIEALVESARQELRRAKLLGDGVEVEVGGFF